MQCDVPTCLHIKCHFAMSSEPFGLRTTDVRVNNEVMMINRYLNVKDDGYIFSQKRKTLGYVYLYVVREKTIPRIKILIV